MPVENCLTGIERNCTNLNASGMQWIIGQARQQDNTVKQLFDLAQLRGVGAVLHKVHQCGKHAQLTLCQEVRSILYLQLLQRTNLHLKPLLLLNDHQPPPAHKSDHHQCGSTCRMRQ